MVKPFTFINDMYLLNLIDNQNAEKLREKNVESRHSRVPEKYRCKNRGKVEGQLELGKDGDDEKPTNFSGTESTVKNTVDEIFTIVSDSELDGNQDEIHGPREGTEKIEINETGSKSRNSKEQERRKKHPVKAKQVKEIADKPIRGKEIADQPFRGKEIVGQPIRGKENSSKRDCKAEEEKDQRDKEAQKKKKYEQTRRSRNERDKKRRMEKMRKNEQENQKSKKNDVGKIDSLKNCKLEDNKKNMPLEIKSQEDNKTTELENECYRIGKHEKAKKSKEKREREEDDRVLKQQEEDRIEEKVEKSKTREDAEEARRTEEEDRKRTELESPEVEMESMDREDMMQRLEASKQNIKGLQSWNQKLLEFIDTSEEEQEEEVEEKKQEIDKERRQEQEQIKPPDVSESGGKRKRKFTEFFGDKSSLEEFSKAMRIHNLTRNIHIQFIK